MSIFKEIQDDGIIHRGNSFFLIKDKYPVSPGHILIISDLERIDFFDLSEEEREELNDLIIVAKDLIEKEYKPDGYNIGMNCGKVAGQSIMHFHCHVIPRYYGDMKNPLGGIRHCVEGKGYY